MHYFTSLTDKQPPKILELFFLFRVRIVCSWKMLTGTGKMIAPIALLSRAWLLRPH
jgi:hypothetical protein